MIATPIHHRPSAIISKNVNMSMASSKLPPNVIQFPIPSVDPHEKRGD